jgi:broad specificity phosphatase PhoE
VSQVFLYLVRHGRPTATFAEATDAGLDPSGSAQAEAVAHQLAPLGPLAIVSSPLRRTRETAAPLERLWGRPARVDTAVAEIPSPAESPARRGEWPREVVTQRWAGLPTELCRWRAAVLETLLGLTEPTVVFTHYVAINVAVGEAVGDDRVVVFAPAHCSVTVLEAEGAALRLLDRGAEAETQLR